MMLREILKRISLFVIVLISGALAPYVISIKYGVKPWQNEPTNGAIAIAITYALIVILFAAMAAGFSGKLISTQEQDKQYMAKLEHFRSKISPYILAILIPYLLYLSIKLIMLIHR